MTSQIGKKNPQTNHGFTLIELVLVILLISILTALSAPLFKRTFSDLVLRDASLDMAKVISYAREMAIIERVNYRLDLNFEERKYRITRYNPSGEDARYEKIKGRHGKDFILASGLGLSAGENKLVFYPDGRSDKLTIKIRDGKTGEGRILEVKGFGSAVEIKRIKK